MKVRNRLMISVALLGLALASSAKAQVLDQVPSNAIAVFKIKSLNGLNAKVIKLANAWGIDEMVPEFKDPLGSVLEKAHLTQGVNKDGDMALALFPAPKASPAPAPAAEAGGDDAVGKGLANTPPPLVLGLLPVSDYKAFVGNFKNPQEDGEITTAANPEDNKPVFIAHWGDYAAVSDTKALLENKPAGFKLAGLAAQEAEKDITVFANMEQMRTSGPKLKEERQKILDQMSANLGKAEGGKKLQPLVKAIVNMYMNAVQDYLEQGTSGVASVDLSDAGINAATFAEFAPDSRLGKSFSTLRGQSADSALAGLPDRKYFAVAAYAADGKVAQEMFSQLADPVAAELAEAGDEWKSAGDIVASSKDALGSITTGNVGYVVPSGAVGQEAILQSVGVTTGDAKAIRDDYRKMFASLADLMKGGPQSPNAPMTIDFKPDDKTVDGVSFDHFQANLAMDQNDPKAAQAQQAIALLYGPNGVGSYSGMANDKQYVVISGGSDQLISDLLASVKAGQDVISSRAPVAMVASHLPKNPVLVYYLFLDQIATSATKMAANFGFPIKLTLPDNLPPIGFAAATNGPSIRFETFIPSDLIQNLISAALKAKQDMQAGNNGPQ
jgi:hypothetical protein